MMSRNSNIELLRIISMLLIIQSHFAFHGYLSICGGDYANLENGIKEGFLRMITTGNIGNAIFMIITGFFLYTSRKLSLLRLTKFVVQVFTYSTVCYLIYAFIYNNGEIGVRALIEALTPLSHTVYWYFTAYILIYLFHPFINLVINNVSKKSFIILIGLTITIWGFAPSLLSLKICSSEFFSFLQYYFIGAYIHKYHNINSNRNSEDSVIETEKTKCGSSQYKNKVNTYVLIGCVFLWILISFSTLYTTEIVSARIYKMSNFGSPLNTVLGCSIFIFFLNLPPIKSSKIVNTIAGCVGGVYLLHDNPYMRSIIYNDIFHLDNYINTNEMYFYTLLFVLMTFAVGVIVEWLRKELYTIFEKKALKEKIIILTPEAKV